MRWSPRLLVAVALLALVALRIAQLSPPAVVPASAPPEVFSAERAREHLARIAAEPRPTGSAAHRRARDYLLAELSKLGVQPEIQSTSVLSRQWGLPYDAAHVENLVARLPGADSTGAVALVAHYDSVPGSPGAADDGSGVAALLETLRALRSGAQLRNDVLLLFTDAEEGGILGGKAFMDEHPLRGEVGIALNFDARGAGGVVAMFDTGPGDAWPVRELARAAPYPVASSLFPEVARRMGHSTDFSVFKRAGIPGLNFAFSDGAAHYHAPSDTVSNLDLRSVQHAGDYALSLARRFGALDLGRRGGESAVYFNTWGAHLVSHPTSWVPAIAALIACLFAGVAAAARRRQVASLGRIAAGSLGFLALLLGVSAAAGGLAWALRRAHPVLRAMPFEPYNAPAYRLAIALAALAAASAGYRLLRRRLGACEVALGALLVWLLLLAAASSAMPGASFYFAWPLASALLGLAAVTIRRGGAPPAPRPTSPPTSPPTLAPTWTDAAILVAAAAPAVAVAVPGPYLLFVALGLPAAAAPALAVALVFGLFLPHAELLGGGRSRSLALAFGVPAVAALAVACATGGFTEARPRPASLAYALDAAAGEAHWLSADRDLDPWTAAYFPEDRAQAPSFEVPYVRLTRQSEAPVAALPAPALTVLSDVTSGGVRALRLRVASPRGAPWLLAEVASPTEVLRAEVDGRRVEESARGAQSKRDVRWGFTYMGLPAGGIEWSLEVEASGPVQIRLMDQTYELPRELVRAARPRELMGGPYRLADSTFVSGAFWL
ncbi:M20/M25/M40 family metallo-hydrolase [Sorangium sp. So ce136]|uniref:M20/M25/M40 family metallo-hydrolase n=1 Tax=Sorangium sp. So ce136 TaxID=3133284 RepID=UPI003F074C4D